MFESIVAAHFACRRSWCQGTMEGFKGNLGIRLLRFYRVGDGILEQKSIRINTVFRERIKAAYLKWTKERDRKQKEASMMRA